MFIGAHYGGLELLSCAVELNHFNNASIPLIPGDGRKCMNW